MLELPYKVLRYVKIHRKLPGWENVRERHRLRMPLPRIVQIEPTTLCNFNCAMCTRKTLPDSRKNRSMSFDTFLSIVEQIPTLKAIKLQGLGEPLLTPDLNKMLQWGYRKGIKFDIISNGTLVHDRIDNILPYVSRFVISLDTLSDSVAERLRTPSNLSVIKQAVKEMVLAKKRLNCNAVVGVNCVVSHMNQHEIEDIMKFGVKTGVDYVGFVLVENWKVSGESGYEESKDFVRMARNEVDMNHVRSIYMKKNYSFSLGILDGTPRKGCCQWSFKNIYITCDGYVTPCCIRTNPDICSFGNVNDQPFKDIWNNKALQAFRRTHLVGESNPICNSCPA